MAVLITGGARSGKSSFAETYAAHCSDHGIFIATMRPYDDEMSDRVRLHRDIRQASEFRWTTVEEQMNLVRTLDDIRRMKHDAGPPVVLVDCLTLWLTNWMLHLSENGGEWTEQREAVLQNEIEALTGTADSYPLPLLFVTNEVGSGIVPEYPLGRRFRDAAGRLNQRMAAVCDKVFLVTAGIPVELKSIAFGSGR